MKFILMIFILLLSGCSKVTNDDRNITNDIFIDDLGYEIDTSKEPERIISTYSAITENLFVLGVGGKIIGVGSSETYPPEVLDIDFYSYKDDAESFIAGNPDLVFVRTTIAEKYKQTFDALRGVGIAVVALDNEGTFDEYVMKIAKSVSKEDVAVEKLATYNERFQVIKEKATFITDKKIIFFESRENEYSTISKNSIIWNDLELIGCIHVTENDIPSSTSTYVSYGVERLLGKSDKIDFYIIQNWSTTTEINVDDIKNREGFEVMTSVQEDNILIIDKKIITSPTFRHIEGLELIYNTMYE